jgi:hypothetical protein
MDPPPRRVAAADPHSQVACEVLQGERDQPKRRGESAMKCRPGDLAVVVAARNKSNIGLIVRVLRLHDDSGDLAFHIDQPVWVTECCTRMTWTNGKKRFRRKVGPIPDAQLQPIRGPTAGPTRCRDRDLSLEKLVSPVTAQ